MEKGIRRRDFFKTLAAGGAAGVTVAACSDPAEKLIPYLLPPENIEFTPGKSIEYATTCQECPVGCGMVVRTREGRAIKAEGNPDHPLNAGALCMRGQASVQTHYNPARIATAQLRQGNALQPATWEAAEAAFADKLKAISNKLQVVLITGNAAGTRGRFLDQWLSALGAAPKVVLEPLTLHSIRAANQMAFRRAELPQYRMDQADLLVGFGAEFLETWTNPVENNRLFAAMHAYNDATGKKGRFVHIGPHKSLTGANADQWVNIKPGTETVLALALAREVLAKTRVSLPGSEKQRLAEFLQPFTPERAAKETGVAVDHIKGLAAEIAAAESSLILGGGNTLATVESTQTQLAVNLLNYVAGNIGRTVVFGAGRVIDPSTSYKEVMDVVNRMISGDVKLLIVDSANPLYSLPATSKIAAALDKVETIVSLSSAWDETTHRAHIVLPSQSTLERWGDASPQKGIHSLVQPVMSPLYPVKAAEDTLISVSVRLGVTVFAATPVYKSYLMAAWKQVQQDAGDKNEFDTFWRDSLRRGGVFQKVSASTAIRLNEEVFQTQFAAPKLDGEGLVLLPTVSLRVRDGRGASNPWLQEIPDPVSQVVWDSWADINPETAKSMGIAHGDRIRVKSNFGTFELAAYLHYGVNADAIAIPIGQGHTASGRNADDVGVNVLDLLPSAHDRLSGEFAFVTTRVKVERVSSGGKGYLVQNDGSPRQLGRGIIQTQTLEMARSGKKPASEHGTGHVRQNVDFYPEREKQTAGYYDPYRWGMVVDSDRCTGCSACVAACYAENNLAVVGKTRIGMGREMAWLQINRFIEGEGDDHTTLMQPMMCQQCSNAGCEPVCPVYATYHNPEGLNAQIYNRCVGTRYCSNNCVYKMRRFNWFNYEWEAPLNLQLNPDVTVRSKGVMEKCTFCVQRIQHAKKNANAQGRNLADGEVTPACVQTCPTSALTFGNLKDPNSQVSKKAMRVKEQAEKRVRQYEVFPELKQLPAVTYLRKVTFKSIEEA
ncbi:MAG: molybdopterin-dependent oxidoreductase [Deltaproteobacteria bacterium]|nr:molybdopterin-dependent oxidoreductase [Deltaproteobacteria bacterium]